MNGIPQIQFKVFTRRPFFRHKLNRIWNVLTILFCISFCCLVADSEGVDSKAVQKELQHDLFSVNFPTEKDGWACGRRGTILHTEDGGKTWVRQKTDTDYTLTSISFVDPQHGWVVGNGGTILSTADGGTTWVKQKSPVDYFLMGVHFTDAQKGWIVGERSTIYHSADGGKTWRVQFRGPDHILKAISFCDDKNGWVSGEFGFIYHTKDGGTTWEKQAGTSAGFSEETGELVAGNTLFNVIAVNPKTAWAIGIDGHALKTTDSGATWKTVEKGIPKTHLFGLAFGREGMDIIIGGFGFLATSTDSGNTFKVSNAEPPVMYGWLYGIAPRGKAGFVAVGSGGWIYVTDKEYKTWRLAENL